MNNENKGRLVTDYQIPDGILKKGVELNDSFILEVFQNGKKSLNLNRINFQISSDTNFSIDYVNCQIKVPNFNFEKINCEIIGIKTDDEDKEEFRFIVRSLNNVPFKLNGNWSFESFLEKGDVIELGLNKIIFKNLEPRKLKMKTPESIIKSTIPILIEGDTGTGKTRLAKIFHEASGRVGNFVHLNLSSFSAGLIESELFGHVKGAFTGASFDKKGAINEANKGTLFLDEIDSLSLEIQTKLLIFLESYEFRSVGCERLKKADTRIIFASGKKLAQLVQSKHIRNDFYFRIRSGHQIVLKSLKENPRKIVRLCEDFERNEYVIITDELKEYYKNLNWPGNVRQLISHLNKKKILSEGKKLSFDQFDQELLDENLNDFEQEKDGKIITLENLKYNYCVSIYNKFNQNKRATCKALEISQNTLKKIIENRAA
jgi:transcriptional regulator with PAS, ATPase and Fis domain